MILKAKSLLAGRYQVTKYEKECWPTTKTITGMDALAAVAAPLMPVICTSSSDSDAICFHLNLI